MPSSIDDMKALLNKRNSVARGNRYGVHFTHPHFTQDMKNFSGNPHRQNQTPSSNDNNWIQDGHDTWILCTAVTLPGKRISTTEATHNHNLAKKPYSMATDEVTMSFLLTGDYYMKKYFDVWQEMIVDSTGNHYKTMYKDKYTVDVDIQALIGNEDNTIGYSCKLLKAYPIQVGQVDLGNSAEGLIEMNVTWEYDNWKIQDVREGFDLGR